MEDVRELRPERSLRTSSCGYPWLSFIHIVDTEFQAACQGQIYVLRKILTLTLEGRRYHWVHFTARKTKFRESR